MQAQDNQASRFGIRARSSGCTEADVVAAIVEQRSVVRTWLMRGTIHLVDTADLRWLVAIIGPTVVRKYRTRWRQLGLHDDVLERSLDLLPAILAGRFTAFAPATATDFTTWPGLPGTRAVQLIRDELDDVDVFGRPGYRLGHVEPERSLRLLPAFDNYLLGYRERDAVLSGPDYRRIYDGGIIRPALLADGRVVGSWSLNRAKRTVTLAPFERLTRATSRALEREVADLSRFTALDLATVVDGP